MYLTNDEFLILSGIKMGLSYQEISKKFGLKICTNDPRIGSLCQKYGVESPKELIKTAELKKVEVRETQDIPYFEYDENGFNLVKKISITKKDVEKIWNFFENMPANKPYELIAVDDFYNMQQNLEIQDPGTGKKSQIASTIDGYDI